MAPTEPSSSGVSSEPQAAPPARRSRVRSALAAAVTLFLLATITLAGAVGSHVLAWRSFLDRPLPLPPEGLLVDLQAGQTVEGLARQFQGQGLLPWPHWLSLYARFTGAATRLKAGEYRVPAGATPRDLLQMLQDGRVVQYSFTIVEGWTFAQVRHALEQHPVLKATLADLSPEAVMERIGARGVHPEGRFLPETYHFPRGATDAEVLRRARRDMNAALASAWAGRSPTLDLKGPDEALILASIIERETGRAEERARVAGVLVRRLRKGMALQVDPTVIYGLGEPFDGNLRREHLTRDTPYNTYVRVGLPPTPIAMPGRASLQAAVQPEAGTALFYVSRGDGSHHFSDTYEAHRRAVAEFQSPRATAPAGEASRPPRAP